MPIEYRTGNMFESGADVLVCTVNCIGPMGKGVALQFRRKYPELYERYLIDCLKGNFSPGSVKIYASNDYLVACVATKDHWRYSSHLEWVELGLQNLRISMDYMVPMYCRKPVSSIAMPPLGCGNGGLNWKEVKPLVSKWFGNVSYNVLVFEPNHVVGGQS